MCLQSWHQIPRKIFPLVRLRFRLSFFPGSHHVPGAMTNLLKHMYMIKFQKTKAPRHEHTSSNHVQQHQVQSQQHQPFFMMSPSDLLATPSSECLQERCSRHRH